MSRFPTREEDILCLNILHLTENEGLSARQAAEKLGTTKSAVLGFVNRVRNAQEPCECTKPENKDGGMPERWWDVPH